MEYNQDMKWMFSMVTIVILVFFFTWSISFITGYSLLYFPVSLLDERQIVLQMIDERDRAFTPASTSEIQQMQSDPLLCFHSDDCRVNPNVLSECNPPAYNKYYCTNHLCPKTLMGCISENNAQSYVVCEKQQCKFKTIKVKTWKDINGRIW